MTAGAVERPRLIALLDWSAPFSIVRAPIGFGKSVLLRQWAEHAQLVGITVAWARIEPEAQGESLWAPILQAVTETLPPTDDSGVEGSSFERLSRVIATIERSTFLVVDSFENFTDSVDARHLLELVRGSEEFHVVIGTRTHRLSEEIATLDLDASVIGPKQLLMNVAEISELAAKHQVTLSTEGAVWLKVETGGWPAVVHSVMTRLAQFDGMDARDAVEASSDYYWRHLVTHTLSAESLEFLGLVATAEFLTIPAAEFLTGQQDALDQLKVLELQGLLARHPADGTYEIPHLLRRMSRLQGDDARLRSGAELTAFYADQGRPDLALRQATADGNWLLAARLIETHWRQLMMRHETLTSKTVIAMPADIAQNFVKVRAARQVLLGTIVSYDEYPMPLPEAVADIDRLAVRPDAALTLELALLTVLVWRRSGHFAQAAELSRRARRFEGVLAEQAGGTHAYTPAAHVQFALSHQMAGDSMVAADLWRVAYRTSDFDRGQNYAAVSAGNLALILAARGEVASARIWSEREKEATHKPRRLWSISAVDSGPAVAAAWLAIDALDRDGAAFTLRSLSQPRDFDELWGFAAYVRTRFDLIWSDPDLAFRRLRQVRVEQGPWDNTQNIAHDVLLAAEADLLMARGHGNRARALLGASTSDHPIVLLARTRLAYLSGDHEAAAVLALEVVTRADSSERARLEALTWQAILAAPHDDAAAADLWRRALATSESLGTLMSVFALVPRRFLRDAATSVPGMSDIVNQLSASEAQDPFASALTTIELTDREQIVLEKLDEGLSVGAIARALYVSHNTVKSQLRTLYRKLESHSRDEALVVARDTGLLGE